MTVACTRSEVSPPPSLQTGSNSSVDDICGLSMLSVLFLAPRGFSSGYSSFLLSSKPRLSNSNSIWNARTRLKEFLRTILGKQIANYGEILIGFRESPELTLVVTKWYAIVTTQARNETTKYLQNLCSGPKMVVFEIFFPKNDRRWSLNKVYQVRFCYISPDLHSDFNLH